MRNALGVLQVRRVVINNQIVSIDRLRDGPVPQGAEVNLLKCRTAEAQHEQHAVGVGVILCGRRCQVMVQVPLERFGKLIFLQRRVVIVVADFHRAVSRQHFRAGVGLKAQHRLQQKGVPHPVHALDRRSFCGAAEAGNFNLESKQLDAGRMIFDPVLAALDVIRDTAQQFVRNAVQFQFGNVIDQIIKPAGRTFSFVFSGKGLAV